MDDAFPVDPIIEAGYNVSFFGQKTYNGVAILAKGEMGDIIRGIPEYDDQQRRVIAASVNGVRIINLYVPNGQSVGSEKYQYKLEWFAHLKKFVQQEIEQHSKLVIVGDFNIAPEDIDVHDPEFWEGKILCSEPERQQYRDLIAMGLIDAFRLFEQPERSFSWWDYRAAGFRRDLGLRIDLILISEALRDSCSRCVIDKEPRKWERPSDHTPVWVEFNL